jgi:hypothetical protein
VRSSAEPDVVDAEGLPEVLEEVLLPVDHPPPGALDLSDHWSLGLGYRTIEGGADNNSVYNSAWLHSAVISVSFRF